MDIGKGVVPMNKIFLVLDRFFLRFLGQDFRNNKKYVFNPFFFIIFYLFFFDHFFVMNRRMEVLFIPVDIYAKAITINFES